MVDNSVLESSYRSPETDYKNLKKDFEVAMGKAEKEIKNEKNTPIPSSKTNINTRQVILHEKAEASAFSGATTLSYTYRLTVFVSALGMNSIYNTNFLTHWAE